MIGSAPSRSRTIAIGDERDEEVGPALPAEQELPQVEGLAAALTAARSVGALVAMSYW